MQHLVDALITQRQAEQPRPELQLIFLSLRQKRSYKNTPLHNMTNPYRLIFIMYVRPILCQVKLNDDTSQSVG